MQSNQQAGDSKTSPFIRYILVKVDFEMFKIFVLYQKLLCVQNFIRFFCFYAYVDNG